MKRKSTTLTLIQAAMFLAIAFILPFFTGQIPQFGSMLCPMHFPVLLCGFICGWPWGLITGFCAPLLRSFILGMPPLFPKAVCMAFELAAYGAVSGILHKMLPVKKWSVYVSLLLAMLAGRIVYGLSMFICMYVTGHSFGITLFLAEACTNALPGIILQLILIPLIVMLEKRSHGHSI